MKKWWVSWFAHPFVGFTLTSPWWLVDVSSGVGKALGSAKFEASHGGVITAHVIAESDAQARQLIIAAHEVPVVLTFRFTTRQGKYWTPFSQSFPRADWMVLPTATEVR